MDPLPRALLTVSVFLTTATCPQAGLVIPGLFNTGVDDQGNALPVTSPDTHYALSWEGTAGQAYVMPIVYHSPGVQAWVTPPAGSAWIGPSQTTTTWPLDPEGDYVYSLSMSFDLLDVDYRNVQISGRWSSDDPGEVWVNGQHMTGFDVPLWGFSSLHSFLLKDCFLPTGNILEFRVNNIEERDPGNPTGLIVANLEARLGDAPPGPVVPEPATWVAGALLLLPCGFQALRWRRARVVTHS